VDDDVSAMLNGTDQVRGAKGVINDQRQAMLVSDGCDGINIRNITVGVAQSLRVERLGVGLDRVLDLFQIVSVPEGCGDPDFVSL
jgi:hypothetical protein